MPLVSSEYEHARGVTSLWAGVLVAPAAWLTGFLINYMIPPWTCMWRWMWMHHLISLVTFAAAGYGALVAFRNWRTTGGTWPDEEAGPLPRSRFMALGGLALSLMMMLVILAQWVTILFISPCQDQ